MPATITCRISPTSVSLPIPPMPLHLGGITIDNFFGAGSLGDIILKVVHSKALGNVKSPVEMLDLHRALIRLTANPSNVKRVNRVGIILADSFAPRPGAFGFMFDRGFHTDQNVFGRVAREGCAVFVGAIFRARPATFPAEVAFTALHELGHVFNLFHLDAPNSPNLMATDPPIPAAASQGFLPRHVRLLNLCSTRPEIHPGANEFGDLGQLDIGHTDPFRLPYPPMRPPLRLSISMQQYEFWRFEPIELDITLSVRRGTSAAFDVPDALDPGYDIFRIWIEQPSGERRMYRSSKYFCTAPGQIRVAPGVPFRRDLSIFGQSGDYTFTRAGEHRIRAEFAIPGLGKLQSNELVVNVLPITSRDRMVLKASPVMEKPEVARMLFYRNGSPRSNAFEELQRLARSIRSTPAAAGIEYALGRVLVARLPRQRRGSALAAASTHLHRALDHSQLSAHRREIAEKLIAEIESA